MTQQKLDKARRELVILAVARLEGGIYEWVQHVPIGERAGCAKEQIAALEALHFDDPAFDARAKAMLRLVYEVVREVKASRPPLLRQTPISRRRRSSRSSSPAAST